MVSARILPRESECLSMKLFGKPETASHKALEEGFHLGHHLLSLRSQQEPHGANDSQPHLATKPTGFLVV